MRSSTHRVNIFFVANKQLNFWHKVALEHLANDGLTANMLLNRHENGYEFNEDFCYGLISLVKKHHFTIQQAIKEIEGLSQNQAMGIHNGLLRADVIELENFSHITAMEYLKSYGLTPAMLISRNDKDIEFTQKHTWALRNLVIDRHFTIEQALSEIEGLNKDQVGGVEYGLHRRDVIGLNNFWHIAAMKELKPYGLRSEMLTSRYKKEDEFDASHCYALCHLVQKRHFTIEQALSEIAGLSKTQAAGIQEGLTRNDVLGLHNFWHIQALASLKNKGLTADRLARCKTIPNFDAHHCFALRNMVEKGGQTVEEALRQIEGLSDSQVFEIEKRFSM